MATTPMESNAVDPGAMIVTESRPSDLLASLHDSAGAPSEYVFGARDADPNDVILVVWDGQVAVGYIAVSDLTTDGMLVWEHVIVPSHRARGLGRRLLFEAARRAVSSAVLEIDPRGELDLDRVADYYQQYGFRREDGAGRLTATSEDVVAHISRQHAATEARATVADLLKGKAPGAVTVSPTTTVHQAIAIMNERGIGAVVVSSDSTHIAGILSERDVLASLAAEDFGFLDQMVGDRETRGVVTCTADDSIGSAMDIMTRLRIRHLPVTQEGRLVGVISPGDIVKFRLDAVEAAAYLEQAGFFDN